MLPQALTRSASARDLRWWLEALGVVAITWLLLGWYGTRAIAQADATVTWIPYLRHALGSAAWTDHLYGFGVVGGAPLHATAGTLPLVQLCAALEVSPTTTANLITGFAQTCLGFFGLRAIADLARLWSPGRELAGPERVLAIWAVAFAPVLGWRLALGHENLVLGLVPFAVAIALVLAARAGTTSPALLGLGALAAWHGFASIGPQTLLYSLVFGAPLAIALVAAREPARWHRRLVWGAAALVAALLVALPRLAPMFAHAASDDFPRGGEAVVHAYGVSSGADWLRSIPWLAAPLAEHERNFALGPLVLLLALVPRGGRRVPLALALAAGLAVLFGSDVSPIAGALLAAVPPLEDFRAPGRAVLPVLAMLPIVALAAWLARVPADGERLARWGWIVGGALVILAGRWLPGELREGAAWLGAGALGVLAWRRRVPAGSIAVVAALGVSLFGDRFPREAPHRRIEELAELRTELLAQAPELAMPLHRIQIVDAPPPYEMSTAFAAGLSSLDGAWYPTRRFLALLATLSGQPVDPTTYVFRLTRTRAFPALQQLYDVRYVLALRADGSGALERLPDPPGPAWFVEHVEVVEAPAELAARLADPTAIRTTGWVLREDLEGPPPPAARGCTAGAVTVDEHGQRATIAVEAPADCTLVVATSFTRALVATANGAPARVLPIDVALAGIVVPRGTTRVELGPVEAVPGWARAAGWLGLALLVAACAGAARYSKAGG